MGSVEYLCVCGWRGDTKPEDWRCPRCGDLVGWAANETEELQPGQRAEWVFGRWQRRQGIAAIVEKVFDYPFHQKRLKHNGKLTSTGRKIVKALMEYAELNGISTERGDWFLQATRLVAEDMFSVVLPLLPGLRLDGMDADPSSLEEWARTLRRLMNREATEELLGAGADVRRQAPYLPREVEAERVALLARVGLLSLEIEFARRSGRLNRDDERVMQALEAADGNEREAAKSINWTEERFRKRVQRMREKLA
jgi:hypothetical protein